MVRHLSTQTPTNTSTYHSNPTPQPTTPTQHLNLPLQPNTSTYHSNPTPQPTTPTQHHHLTITSPSPAGPRDRNPPTQKEPTHQPTQPPSHQLTIVCYRSE
ncbi:hypothetical protein Pmani_029260 [Petrolisthes manimaculis]|uniref:Uncharacterized protein n=1 Tax=Petrolisthes manimaculis TaxID=1843537 RepID=A0AAE1TX56_9EUCA|nr:hypothetical protein Pmani_029260 [Petrolisthes manimaculis]